MQPTVKFHLTNVSEFHAHWNTVFQDPQGCIHQKEKSTELFSVSWNSHSQLQQEPDVEKIPGK